MKPTCGHRLCKAPATRKIVPQYGPAVLRCDDHAGDTLEVYSKFDNRQGAGSRSEPLA